MAHKQGLLVVKTTGRGEELFIEDGGCAECQNNKHKLREVHDQFKKLGVINNSSKTPENPNKEFRALFNDVTSLCYVLIDERKKRTSNATSELLQCLNENTSLRHKIEQLEEKISELDHENNELRHPRRMSEPVDIFPTQVNRENENVSMIHQHSLGDLRVEQLEESTILDYLAEYWEKLANGLDFKKYEEIINYIQTWAKNLQEPKDLHNTTSTLPDKIELDLESEYTTDENAFLVINEAACVEQIVKACNRALETALENKLVDLVVVVKEVLCNRKRLLSEDLEWAESYLESTENYYGRASLTKIGQPLIELAVNGVRQHIQRLRDRLKFLEQLRPEDTRCGREDIFGRRVVFAS